MRVQVLGLVMLMLAGPSVADSGSKAERSVDGPAACMADVGSAERSGCCSHHGGVCGCAGDQQKCCDGTLSPSCECVYDGGDAAPPKAQTPPTS